MRYLITIARYFALVSVLVTCQESGLLYNESDIALSITGPSTENLAQVSYTKFVDCFDYAESVTGFSAEILRGIAATESCFVTTAVGDGGMSLGMFQLHSRWYESRVEKWGSFDPFNPFESAVIAGKIMQENLNAFNGDLNRAIAAYKQGIYGVLERGVIWGYVNAVLNWRCDPEKRLSFFIFIGITDAEVVQDGHKVAEA